MKAEVSCAGKKDLGDESEEKIDENYKNRMEKNNKNTRGVLEEEEKEGSDGCGTGRFGEEERSRMRSEHAGSWSEGGR